MTKLEIFEIIKRNLVEILPELAAIDIDATKSMKELGANSIDRVDVVLQSMEALSVTFPLNELGGIENIQGLVDYLEAKVRERR